jgi:hypothetical protein
MSKLKAVGQSASPTIVDLRELQMVPRVGIPSETRQMALVFAQQEFGRICELRTEPLVQQIMTYCRTNQCQAVVSNSWFPKGNVRHTLVLDGRGFSVVEEPAKDGDAVREYWVDSIRELKIEDVQQGHLESGPILQNLRELDLEMILVYPGRGPSEAYLSRYSRPIQLVRFPIPGETLGGRTEDLSNGKILADIDGHSLVCRYDPSENTIHIKLWDKVASVALDEQPKTFRHKVIANYDSVIVRRLEANGPVIFGYRFGVDYSDRFGDSHKIFQGNWTFNGQSWSGEG